MDAEALEKTAREARRRADIAKHKPLSIEQLDAYGEEQIRTGCHAQINLINMATDLQTAYAHELQALGKIIRTLRDEALYWRQKFHELESTWSPDLAKDKTK